MINLLPPDVKENILYARRNTKLVRWVVAMVVAIVGIFAVVVFGQLYMNQSIKTYARQAEQTREKLRVQKLDETQQRVTDISSSLKLVVQVLSREILFSKLLRQIGAAIPSGAVMSELTINKVGGGIDLSFETVDYQTATQVQLNLQDPDNKIFEKADIVSVSCDNDPADKYKCQIELRALFTTNNNPFLFINNSQSGPAQ